MYTVKNIITRVRFSGFTSRDHQNRLPYFGPSGHGPVHFSHSFRFFSIVGRKSDCHLGMIPFPKYGIHIN